MLQRRPARWRLWRGLKTPLEGSGALALLTWGVTGVVQARGAPLWVQGCGVLEVQNHVETVVGLTLLTLSLHSHQHISTTLHPFHSILAGLQQPRGPTSCAGGGSVWERLWRERLGAGKEPRFPLQSTLLRLLPLLSA